MRILKGQKVSEGVAIGPAMVFSRREIKVKEAHVAPDRVDNELRRFARAVEITQRDIRRLRDEETEFADVKRIVDTSLTLLSDELIVGSVESLIRDERCTAPHAVSRALAKISEQLTALANPVFASKAADVNDIEHRLLDHLLGGGFEKIQSFSRRSIVVADELTPTQAATLDRDNVLGFATEQGSWASHTAILARAIGIPAVVGVPWVTKFAEIGSSVIIDGTRGLVVIDPDEETTIRYRRLRRQERQKKAAAIRQQRKLPSVTRDGESCVIAGNIETKDDIPRLLEFGGEGVGLFRTEFLYLGRDVPPDEDEQLEVYRSALESMKGAELTIRSMDFGGDKFDRRQNAPREPNPFMGERSIRVSFKREGVFREQLRAILRASPAGRAKLMFPMIMDLGQFRKAKGIVLEEMAALRKKGIPFDENLPIGTMIEVPSAVMTAEQLASEVAFFSIGTNDLTSYALAVDRTNQRVSDLYAPHHPSLARMIGIIAKVGKEHGVPVSLCGEAAGDPYFLPLLIGLGVRNFSVAPPLIPGVRRKIRSLYVPRCVRLAEDAVVAADAAEVRKLLDEVN